MSPRAIRFAFRSLLALPALWLGAQLAMEADPWLADHVAASGEWSARFLILALCLTPLQRLLGHARWLAFLIRHRRAIGLAAFFYTLLHLGLYLLDMGAIGPVLDEAGAPAMLAGWAGLALLIPLALTSNDGAMRRLGRSWKILQRLAYPAALLTLLHWLWVHGGSAEAWLHFAPLILLQALRLFSSLFRERKFA